MYTVHPNLDVNYFDTIDTKEKAYWFGFLFADGSMTRTQRAVQIRLELSRDDEDTINRYCDSLGLEKRKKEYRIHRSAEKETVEIRFACKKMSNDLISHGLTFRKSKRINFPKLLSRDLELAFLLGYYDGDGQQNTTRVSSGNIKFLETVKKRFSLAYKINVTKGERKLCGRTINGTVYYMSLGLGLFNEMMSNYASSMSRKRWFHFNSDKKPL